MEPPRTTAQPKLRDSCEGCAISKMKCPRQKPTCSRCAKRGLQCVYLATRRGGRKSVSAKLDKTENGPSPPPTAVPNMISDHQVQPAEMVFGGDWFQAPADDFMHQVSGSPFHIDLISPMNTADMGNDFEDYFASPKGLLNEASLLDPWMLSLPTQYDDTSRAALFGPMPIPDSNIMSEAASHSGDSYIADTTMSESIHTECADSCLDHAMALIKDLSCSDSGLCSSSRGADGSARTPPTTQHIIATNKRTDSRLVHGRRATGDAELLLVIVLREPAADGDGLSLGRLGHDDDSSSSSVEGFEDHQQYMAGRQILSELHHVQRLVKQLCERMSQQRGAGEASQSQSHSFNPMAMGGSDVPSLSSAVWDQASVDLKLKLKSLSMGIVSKLRRE
ncbi:hypothetical protein G7054_g7116 [Neopestalotiopsis clavispora]|nr:hypothetical protein G7054_g7116 [Neopestalotiopsis clavispora]